ncbi:MAG: arylsulfatase [Planctomycetes bacterium RBG_13_60_9]|nr:MAG: arylsulfatase [Planctomycetes bacterium RBG_13_60_9]
MGRSMRKGQGFTNLDRSNRMCTRRDFLRTLGAGVIAVSLPGCGVTARRSTQRSGRPNIILIMSDDMGFSDLGCYGGEIRTPNLDGLAAEGLRFTQFYNTARCCPTRASLMTGLYPHQAGIGHMTEDRGFPAYRGDLAGNCVTIAQVLQSAGYRTYMAGKWHVTRYAGKDGPKHNWPLQRGFERFYGTITGAGSFYDPTTLCRDNTYITPANDPEYKPQSYYYTDAISDNTIRYVREHCEQSPGKPFFMYVAYTAAHWPMHAPEADIARNKGKYDGGYENCRRQRFERMKQMGLIRADWNMSPQAGDWDRFEAKDWEARCMEVYAAMVEVMDRGIGRIVDELKMQGTFDNTLILFLQDNGGCAEDMGRGANINQRWVDQFKNPGPMGPDDLQPSIWPPMRTRDGRSVRGGPTVMPGPADTYIAYGRNWANISNTPFREYKHWVHEGGISTPLICHWPAGIRARDRLCHEPGHLVDIMATCVDLAGAQYPSRHADTEIQPMEGVSLAPVFQGRPLRDRAIFWEHEGNRAVRRGKWKLVVKHPGDWELYDIDAARTEMHDLAPRMPEKVEELKPLWESWAARCGVQPWPLKKPSGSS